MVQNSTIHNSDRRVQFDFNSARIADMEKLILFCDMKTRKELIDNALSLFEWAVDEIRDGKQIASYKRDTDKVEIIRMPSLENAVKKFRESYQIDSEDINSNNIYANKLKIVQIDP